MRFCRPLGLALAGLVTALPSAAQQPAPLADRLARYQPGVTEVPPLPRDLLWTGAGDFRRDATAWIAAGGQADLARRRLAVATYVLDVLKDVEERALWAETQAATSLVEWACGRLRESAPLPAERAWHVAALALLERSAPVAVIRHHLDHAASRVPTEPKWVLARALVDELESGERRKDDGTLAISGGLASRARQRFEQASALPSVRQEALLRWASFESDLGRPDVALAMLDRIGPPAGMTDPFLRYWFGIVKGRALRRVNRTEDAVEAYRAAVAEFPTGQAGAMGLAEALVASRRLVEAAAIVNRVATQPDDGPPDPWRMYWLPDSRFWPLALDQLRQAVSP